MSEPIHVQRMRQMRKEKEEAKRRKKRAPSRGADETKSSEPKENRDEVRYFDRRLGLWRTKPRTPPKQFPVISQTRVQTPDRMGNWTVSDSQADRMGNWTVSDSQADKFIMPRPQFSPVPQRLPAGHSVSFSLDQDTRLGATATTSLVSSSMSMLSYDETMSHSESHTGSHNDSSHRRPPEERESQNDSSQRRPPRRAGKNDFLQ